MRMAGVLMPRVATMIASVAATTATVKPVRRRNHSGLRVVEACIIRTVPLLGQLVLPLFLGVSRDTVSISIGTATA